MRHFIGLLAFLPTWAMASALSTQEYHLKNGLTVLVREDHRAPVVYSSIWYKVGGSDETDGSTGLSHMLEHMMFKGTALYGPGVLNQLVSREGGEQNAFTTDDYTGYYQIWSKDKLPLSFQLEADRMKNLRLDPNLYAKEHQVVMEERRMRVDDNPQGAVWERFNALAHVNNPYHHPTIGWMTDIAHLSLADLTAWYHTWYTPNNAVVVVVGDVDPQAVLQLAEKNFGPIAAQKLPVRKPQTEISNTGFRQLHMTLPAQMPWLVMGWNTPELPQLKDHPEDIYALTVLANILAGSNSARLSQRLMRGQQLASSVNADYSPLRKYSDLLVIMAVPTPNCSLAQLQTAILQEVNHLKQQPVSQTELASVKAQVIAQNVYDKDSLETQASNLALPEMIGLSWKISDEFVANIEAVTPEQVQAVAKKYLISSELTIATLLPNRQK